VISRAVVLSALAGAAYALTTPPTGLTILTWVGVAGLAWALDEASPSVAKPSRAWFEGGARGLAFGFGASVVAHRFVPGVIARFTPLPFVAGVVALVLLALAQGVPWAVGAMGRSALVRAGVPRPVAFAVGMYGAAFVPAIFPWTLADGITRWTAMIQLADAVGSRGVAALFALSAGLAAHAIRCARSRDTRARSYAPGAIALAIPLVMTLYGAARITAIEHRRDAAPTIKVGLIQPAIEATLRWDPIAAPAIVRNLAEQTRIAESHGARVSVWPESAYPYVLARGAKTVPQGDGDPFLNGIRGPLILGAITIDGDAERFNAVLGARADHVFASEYDKLHLLWFGEEVPFAGSWPWLRRTFVRGIGLVPGDRPAAIDLGRVKAGVLVCFEDILPDAGREAASVGPNLLVNVSNDAWFAGSSESDLHMRMSVLRAVETRRDLVRAVNLGTASFIDAAGVVRAEAHETIPGSLVVNAALLDDPPTLYARWGDGPMIALCLAVALGAAGLRRKEKQVAEMT
jgi:apolipoprotein N-acyltransferase